ncbi:MAG TPA: hypothetical protein VFU00_10150 [Gemmatimonadales bacterium]|nr:hypothetical protein [Gemmatimonadales bacterium]
MKSRQKRVERGNRYFTFLRRLRAGGRSNMYGAIPYLAAAFGLDRNEAFRIVCEWVDSQDDATPPAPLRSDSVGREVAARAPSLFDQVSPVAPPAVEAAASAPRKARGKKGVRAERRPVKRSPRPARRPSGPKAA